jgi:hypothetical protein
MCVGSFTVTYILSCEAVVYVKEGVYSSLE